MLRVVLSRPHYRSPFYNIASLSLHTSSVQAPKMLLPVRTVPFPCESRLSSSHKSAYFADAFTVALPNRIKAYEPEPLARALFHQPPIWFSLLMWIRDHSMSIFGVKRSTEIQAAAEKEGVDTIFVFPIISRTENEIIVGENDKHLNFQASVLIRKNHSFTGSGIDDDRIGYEVIVTTVVFCHGLLGKAYLTIIKPFHILIIRYNLARVLLV